MSKVIEMEWQPVGGDSPSPQQAEAFYMAAGRPFAIRFWPHGNGHHVAVGDLLLFPAFFCTYPVLAVHPPGTFPYLARPHHADHTHELVLRYPPKKRSLKRRQIESMIARGVMTGPQAKPQAELGANNGNVEVGDAQ